MKTLLSIIVSLSLISLINANYIQADTVSPLEKISMKKAKKIALEQVNGKIIAAKEEQDDGMIKYEIIIETKKGWYEVEIDKATGKVLEVEKEGSKGDSERDDDAGERYDD